MTNPITNPRCFHLTPGRFVLALLAVEVLLWLSERFGWPGWHKGYAVLTGVVVVGVATVLMLSWFGVALIFRLRFQFSVRTLLVLVVIVALPCSWMAVEMKKARQQKDAVELFSASDCIVWRDDVTDDNGDLDMDKFDARLTQAATHVRGKRPLTELLGQDFFHAATAIEHDSGGGFELICGKVDDVGNIHSYSSFRFSEDRAQAMLLALNNLPDLRDLDLSGMPTNDSDLENVTPLKRLRQLNLTGTYVTDAGVAKLQQALPNCKITR